MVSLALLGTFKVYRELVVSMERGIFEGKVLEKLDHLEEELKGVQKDVDELKTQAAMGKGALWLLFKLGAIAGVITLLYNLIDYSKS